MHTTARIVGDEDQEENPEMYMENKIKRIWRMVIFASGINAGV